VENGLGDFSFDWVLVQSRVSRVSRICTYDRAGYAWSDPGPKPRTFEQLNLELRDALSRLGEHGPYVLVGHSFGGPVVRNFALMYPAEVAGIILIDSAFEGQRVGTGGKATTRLGDGAKGVPIPPPHEQMAESDRPSVRATSTPDAPKSLDPLYGVLPLAEKRLQLWAQSRPELEDAENSQREWSAEYFAKWLAAPQSGTLRGIPLIVLTRADGGYREGESDISASQLERERKEGQAKLAVLSANGRQVYLHCGHNMELEAPGEVSAAIREMIVAVRRPQR
jgi:pimeloyl-ACP methyl ester carboxylesterase